MSEPAARPSRIYLGRIVGIAIVVGAAVASVSTYRLAFRYPRTDDAAVRANVVGIAPHVGGPIVALNVVDNQHVREGELLFVVDPRPYAAVLERARAELGLTEKEIEAQQSAIAAAEAAVAQREAEAAYAADYLKRVEPLLKREFVTPDKVQDARSKHLAATAALRQSVFERDRAKQLLAQFGDLNARRQAAEAAVLTAQLNVEYCRVRAPFDGYVTNLNISAGEYARQGQQVFALVDNRAWYVMANFQETYLSQIRPGMEAEVYLLSYPNKRFRGTVQGLGWAIYQSDGSTVGVLPAVEPTLNWVRLAQRFPVRVLLQDPDPQYPFRMGTTAVVTIRGDRSDDGSIEPARP